MGDSKDLKIVFFGTGAIGGSVGAWVAAHHARTYLLSRGKMAEAIRTHGLTTYALDSPGRKEHAKVNVITDLNEVPDADVVVVGVKLYDLENAAQTVQGILGDRALIVGMQNGVENQTILPRYFSRVIYCLAAYNAWIDEPGTIGYQTRGPLILGTPDNRLQAEMGALAEIFNPAVETAITRRLGDAAHCKLAINLSNSVTTLLGLNFREISNLDLLQKVLAGTIYEGVQVIRAAGYREERLGGIPSWTTLWAAARLPQFLTRGTFRRNLKKMVVSSMGQDVLQRKSAETELEYLNGYLLGLAERFHRDAPYNRTIYRLCKENFSRADFQPLDVEMVWEEVTRRGRLSEPRSPRG